MAQEDYSKQLYLTVYVVIIYFYLAIAAKEIDWFYIWQKLIYQIFNDLQIGNSTFHSLLIFFLQNGCQFETVCELYMNMEEKENK